MTYDPPRIGLGVDVHRLQPGRPCVLGGVQFESEVGPLRTLPPTLLELPPRISGPAPLPTANSPATSEDASTAAFAQTVTPTCAI